MGSLKIIFMVKELNEWWEVSYIFKKKLSSGVRIEFIIYLILNKSTNEWIHQKFHLNDLASLQLFSFSSFFHHCCHWKCFQCIFIHINKNNLGQNFWLYYPNLGLNSSLLPGSPSILRNCLSFCQDISRNLTYAPN